MHVYLRGRTWACLWAAAIVVMGLVGFACPALAVEGDLVVGDIVASDAIGAENLLIADDGDASAAGQQSDSGGDVDSDGNVEADSDAEVERVPMYRLYNPYTGEHFYTASDDERGSLVEVGWSDEGEAWQAPRESDTPVFRLHNSNAGDHHYTTSSDERDSLVLAGWSDEGVAWYSDGDEGVPLYRLFNPFVATGTHHYTSSMAERTDLVSRGWIAEGVGWYGLLLEDAPEVPIAEGAASSNGEEVTYAPVYRVYCPATDDHLYTVSKDERNALSSWVWHYEGASWQSPSAGEPVYRLSNPYSGEHMYTASAEESGALVRAGWNYEGVGVFSCLDDDEARIPVYRLYSPSMNLHHFTASEGERDALVDAGWQDEGVAWGVHPLDEGFEDDLELWWPRISGDAAFDTQIESIMYYYSDLRKAFDYVAGFPYRSGNRFFSGPHLLDDATTSDMARDMIANHSGNCYRFASLFCWLARGLGYSANVVSGWVPTYSSGHDPHGWTEVYIDGQTYICDPDMVQFYRGTDWFMRTYDNPPTNYGSW